MLSLVCVILAALLYGVSALWPKESEPVHIVIAGEDFTDKTREEATEVLMGKYPWNLSVRYDDRTYSIDNLIEDEIHSAIDKAYNEKEQIDAERASRSFWDKLGSRKEESISIQYDINMPDVEAHLTSVAENLAKEWSKPAVDAAMDGFDASSGSFTYSEPEYGYEIDAGEIADALKNAVESGNYEQEIVAVADQVAPTVTSSAYKLMASYKTTATSNANRNTNIRIASQTIDGMIVQPGEQFSFNGVLGRRTPEKGYKEAAAYANGETVQDYGGGVCQVSSTIYNAIIAAGLQTDKRTGHTYEPSYVTPGQDATVSYDQPDFIFTNTSGHPIGLRTIFENPVVRVEIYGVPILEEGVKRYMQSEKTSDVPPPGPEYIEDPTVPFGQEVIQRNAVNGSVWKTNIITEKNGEVVDTEYFHSTQYRGKNAIIRRNTTVVTPGIPQIPAVVSQPVQESAPVTENPPEDSVEIPTE